MSETLERSILIKGDRRLEPGSSGWTVDEVDEYAHSYAWYSGHYELVDGVIVRTPPAFFGGVAPSSRLVWHLVKHSEEFRNGMAYAELDFKLAADTVFRPDFVWLSKDDEAAHRAQVPRQMRSLEKSRLAVPPTLVIESISEGHERHDRVLKFRRYAEFSVPNYWIIDGFKKRLDCFVKSGSTYQLQISGSADEVVSPALFAPVTIPLAELCASATFPNH